MTLGEKLQTVMISGGIAILMLGALIIASRLLLYVGTGQ